MQKTFIYIICVFPAVGISPVEAVLEKSPPPSDGPVKAAVVVVVGAPRPRVKAVAAGCCGAMDVRTDPNVKPAPAGADEAVEAVRENGVAEAVGLLKARLKPAGATAVAGAPRRSVEVQINYNLVNFQMSSCSNISETQTYLM